MKLFHMVRYFQDEVIDNESIEAVVRSENEDSARKLMYEESAGTESCWLDTELTTCSELKIDDFESVIVVRFSLEN